MATALRVIDPGLHSTIQDAGRPGRQRQGVTVCGALDPVAMRAANLLVGNDPASGIVECLYRGASFEILCDSALLAIAGGEARVELERASFVNRRLATQSSFIAARGDVVRIGAISGSASVCIAASGGFAIAPCFGSVATDVRAGLGGLDGGALKAGDLLPLVRSGADGAEPRKISLRFEPATILRVLAGPQDGYFDAEALERLQSESWLVHPSSNRMGLALRGEPLRHKSEFDIISDSIPPGAIQVPGDGLPVVLLADRQTTGGYPKIATVISADLAALGRARVGSRIRFRLVSLAEAKAAAAELRRFVAAMPALLAPVIEEEAPSFARGDSLARHNLISGVIDAFA